MIALTFSHSFKLLSSRWPLSAPPRLNVQFLTNGGVTFEIVERSGDDLMVATAQLLQGRPLKDKVNGEWTREAFRNYDREAVKR